MSNLAFSAPKTTTNDPNTLNKTTCTCLASSTAKGNYELTKSIQASCPNGFYIRFSRLQVESANESSCGSLSGLYPLGGLIAARLTRLCGSEQNECSTGQLLSSEIYSANYSTGSCFLLTQAWSCSARGDSYPIALPSESSGMAFCSLGLNDRCIFKAMLPISFQGYLIYYIEAFLVVLILACIFMINQK